MVKTFVSLQRAAFPISASRVGLSLVIPLGLSALGSWGIEQQAAFGLAASINNWFLVVGPAILLSGFFKGAEAARSGKQIPRDLFLSVLTLCAMVAGVSLLIALSIAWVLPHVYVADTSVETASRVLVVHALGNIFYFYLTGVMLFLEGMGRSGVTVVIIFAGLLTNLLTNNIVSKYFQNIAEPAVLAAWGTFAGRALAGTAVIAYVAGWILPMKPHEIVFAGRRATIADLLKVGTSSGAGKAAEAAAFTGLGMLAAALGPTAMAGYAIFYSFMSIVYMYLIGFTNATARVFSVANPRPADGLRRLAACLFIFITLYLLLTIAGTADSSLLWRWFRSDPQVRTSLEEMTQPSLIATLSFALVFLGSQLCRSVGLSRAVTLGLVVAYPGLMLVMAAISTLGLGFGLGGLVWSFAIANGVMAALLGVLFIHRIYLRQIS